MKDMIKKKLLMMSVIFLSVMAFNLYRVMPDGKNLRAFWLNIEALAEGDDDDFVAVSKACPKNGGQITTGRPYSKQWSEKYTADRNGKVSAAADGKTYDFGMEYASKRVTLYCYSTECKDSGEKRCIMCNVWCNTRSE